MSVEKLEKVNISGKEVVYNFDIMKLLPSFQKSCATT